MEIHPDNGASVGAATLENSGLIKASLLVFPENACLDEERQLQTFEPRIGRSGPFQPRIELAKLGIGQLQTAGRQTRVRKATADYPDTLPLVPHANTKNTDDQPLLNGLSIHKKRCLTSLVTRLLSQ